MSLCLGEKYHCIVYYEEKIKYIIIPTSKHSHAACIYVNHTTRFITAIYAM